MVNHRKTILVRSLDLITHFEMSSSRTEQWIYTGLNTLQVIHTGHAQHPSSPGVRDLHTSLPLPVLRDPQKARGLILDEPGLCSHHLLQLTVNREDVTMDNGCLPATQQS